MHYEPRHGCNLCLAEHGSVEFLVRGINYWTVSLFLGLSQRECKAFQLRALGFIVVVGGGGAATMVGINFR